MTSKKRQRVQVENLTSHPTREVAALVRYACRAQDVSGDSTLLVRVKNGSRGMSGRYYPMARSQGTAIWDWRVGDWKTIEVKLPPGALHLITIKLPRSFPRKVHYYSRSETPPVDEFASWQEALVWVAAHEAKHHWQYRHRRQRANGRRRWQFKETECDFAGYRTLRAWRAR